MSIARERALEILENDKESRQFDRVENKLSPARDIHAILKVYSLCPTGKYAIDRADDDQVYLGADIDLICETATEADFLELCRCGVHWDEGSDQLYLFV